MSKKIVLFEVENGREIRPELPRNTHINQVSTRWSEKGETLYADYATRGFQNQFVHSIDMKTLQMQTLIHEGKGEQELERHARLSSRSIRDDGRRRVLAGR